MVIVLRKRLITAVLVFVFAGILVVIAARELPQIVQTDNSVKTTIHLSR